MMYKYKFKFNTFNNICTEKIRILTKNTRISKYFSAFLMRKRKNFAENNAFVMHANVRGRQRYILGMQV